MYEPIRGGTRGGAAEFKWTDVSADKDREHYLGHSINAPTGRWQKNKDVHWYSRDQKGTEAERAEEIRRVKEAEEEALSVALGFKPTVRSDPDAPSAVTGEDSEGKTAANMQPSEDIQLVLAKEQRKREKAERKVEKEKRRAEKEQRRAARRDRRRERRERNDSYERYVHGSRSHHENGDRRERERSYSRSGSPPMKRHYRQGGYSRSLSGSRSPPLRSRNYDRPPPHYHGRPASRSPSPTYEGDHPGSLSRRYPIRCTSSPPPRMLLSRRGVDTDRTGPRPPRGRGSPPTRSRSPVRGEYYSDRRELYRRNTSPPPPPLRRKFDEPLRHSRTRSP